MEFIRTPAQAECNAAARMRELGYHDAVAVPAGPDGGIDVRSTHAVGQVKFRGASASRPELQNLYGARGTSHEKEMWFFAASGYTKSAVDYADSVGMLLFTYEPTGELSSANSHAYAKLYAIFEELGRVEQARLEGARLKEEAASDEAKNAEKRDIAREKLRKLAETHFGNRPANYVAAPFDPLYVPPEDVFRPVRVPVQSQVPPPPPPAITKSPVVKAEHHAHRMELRRSRRTAWLFLLGAAILAIVAVIALPNAFASLFLFLLAAVASFIGVITLVSPAR